MENNKVEIAESVIVFRWGCYRLQLGQQAFCLLMFQGGIILFQLMDTYGASGITLLFIACCETIAIAWVYGKMSSYQFLLCVIYGYVNINISCAQRSH